MLSEKALTKKDNNDENSPPPSGRYTIFHALFEALKEKEKKCRKK